MGKGSLFKYWIRVLKNQYAAEDCVGVHGPTAAGVCVDVCGPCYHRRPSSCLWPALPREVTVVSVGCAVSGGYIVVSNMLPPRAMLMPVVCVAC